MDSVIKVLKERFVLGRDEADACTLSRLLKVDKSASNEQVLQAATREDRLSPCQHERNCYGCHHILLSYQRPKQSEFYLKIQCFRSV